METTQADKLRPTSRTPSKSSSLSGDSKQISVSRNMVGVSGKPARTSLSAKPAVKVNRVKSRRIVRSTSPTTGASATPDSRTTPSGDNGEVSLSHTASPSSRATSGVTSRETLTTTTSKSHVAEQPPVAQDKTDSSPPTSNQDNEVLAKETLERERLKQVRESLKAQEIRSKKSLEEAHALSEERLRSKNLAPSSESQVSGVAEKVKDETSRETPRETSRETPRETPSALQPESSTDSVSETQQDSSIVTETSPETSPETSSETSSETNTSKTVKTRVGSSQKKSILEEEGNKGSARVNKGSTPPRRQGKITISQALSSSDEGLEEKTRSLAMIRRKREKERQKSRQALEQQEKVIREVVIPDTITVGELAGRMAERVGEVIKALLNLGVKVTPASEIDAYTAELIVSEFEHKSRRVTEREVESILDEIPDLKDSEQKLENRPPVVTVMGHVDHGKTSLLDALRKTKIQESEAGGITQRISAYQTTMTKDARKITFVDTPGHEAFSAMRARGANITDIVILIIAADAGIMPQTKEAISHAKAAEVPIVVAINKIDLPNANIDKIYNQMLENDLVPEHLGGEVLCVPISAKTGEGLDDLLSNLLLQAELQDCKSSREGPAKGSALEAYIDRGRGCIITLLVTAGTLNYGDIFVVGAATGKIRAIYDDTGQKIKQAFPSQPVEIIGATSAPKAGDIFQVLPKGMENKASAIAEYRKNQEQNKKLNRTSPVKSIDDMFDQFNEKAEHTLMVVVKADVQGMVEAIVSSFEGISFDQYKIRVLHAGVGNVNSSDISLAATAGGMVVAFNVKTPNECQKLARQQKINIINHNIIHHLIEEVEELLQKRKEPELSESLLGVAEIKDIFDMGKQGLVAGCLVTSGEINNSGKIIITRDQDTTVFEGNIKQLKRFRNNVQSVNSGYECGISCEDFENFAIGDRIACYSQNV